MKKSDYSRTTRSCSFNDLKSGFIKGIKTYAEQYNLGDVISEVQHCFETTNTKKGFLGKIKTNYTEICITSKFLFWNIVNDENESGVAAAKWSDISEINDWEKTEMGKMVEDSGVEMYGFIHMSSHRSRWFIGLGNDDAGKQCRTLLNNSLK